MSWYDIMQLLGGIGIFMFGMYMFEQALQALGSERLKQVMQRWTSNTRSSLFAGMTSTALMQSSTITSLLIIGLVAAKFITFGSAFTMILGVNIGTTFSSWIVAIVGFSVQLEYVVAPLLFVAGVSLLLSRHNSTYAQIMKVLAGFGFLFLGLDIIKEHVGGISAGIDLLQYSHLGIAGFAGLGVVMTIVLQSSSLTKALILTAVFSGVIGFDQALGMFIGTNVGTTFTAIIASLGPNILKKQIATAHVMFNVVAAFFTVGVLMLVPWLIPMIEYSLNGITNPTLALALFDTLFNVTRAIIFLPFVPICTQLIESVLPYKEIESTSTALAIDQIQGPLRENKFQAIDTDITYMTARVISFNSYLFEKQYEDESMMHQYERIKTMHNKLLRFVFGINDLPKKYQEKLTAYTNTIQLLMQSAKSLKEVVSYVQEAVHSDHPIISKLYQQTHEKLTSLYEQIQTQPHSFDRSMIKELLGQFRTDDQQFLNDVRSYIKDSHVSEHSMMIITYLHRYSYYSTKALMESII